MQIPLFCSCHAYICTQTHPLLASTISSNMHIISKRISCAKGCMLLPFSSYPFCFSISLHDYAHPPYKIKKEQASWVLIILENSSASNSCFHSHSRNYCSPFLSQIVCIPHLNQILHCIQNLLGTYTGIISWIVCLSQHRENRNN